MIAAHKTETVNFGTKGQVVIPRRLRREFEIEAGTQATVVATPEGILLKPITGAYIKSLRGSLKGTKADGNVWRRSAGGNGRLLMAIKVLDSWALMALFNGEPAADEVEKLLTQAAAGRHKLFMSVVNWGGIYYSVRRGVSPAMAEQKAREMAAMPLEMVPADLPLTHQAAIFKASNKMSYADCFSARRWPKSGMRNSSPATRNSSRWRKKSKSAG